MAINVLRGLRNRGSHAPAEFDDSDAGFHPAAEAPAASRGPRVACPTCGRPLGLLQTECQGCGLRVLAGVPIRHGALLIVAGASGGLLIGLVLAIAIALTGRPAEAAVVAPAPSAVASGPLGSADPALVSGPVPTQASIALRSSATIEDRLAASAAALKAQLRVKSFSAVTAAGTFRTIASDALWGSEQTDGLSDWPAAAPLRAQLEAFYASVRQSARDALSVSIQDNAKYKASAKRMVKLLGSIPSTRAAMTALAAANGIPLPTP